MTSADAYKEANAGRPEFWARQTRELLDWSKDFDRALDWSDPPFAKWFVGGEVNAAYKALDRHVAAGLGDRVAIEGMYFASDGAKKDEDGDIWLLGRVDDVMNISGHRLSTTEIESAPVSHPSLAEAAVVGAADETTGQAVVAFVILRGDAVNDGDATVQELRNHVGKEIGPIAKPKRQSCKTQA